MPDSLIDLADLQVGEDGVIRFANPAAITAFGYDSADELFGRRSHETIHHSYPDGTPYPAADCPMLLPRVTGETVAGDLDWFFRRGGSRERRASATSGGARLAHTGPVEIRVSVGRLPPAVEATAYFAVSETLTNVAKHSRAERAEVTACVQDAELRVQVRDDGVGGARPDGSGLVGLGDRIAPSTAASTSRRPRGTLVTAHIPLRD